jgi:hypothetical protein
MQLDYLVATAGGYLKYISMNDSDVRKVASRFFSRATKLGIKLNSNDPGSSFGQCPQ